MEMIDHIDAQNVVVSTHTYDEIYAKQLRHRIVHVFVMNSKWELLLQQRSKNKWFLPLHWVSSAGGHVSAGETHLQWAKRELQEELWISPELRSLWSIVYRPEENPSFERFIEVFTCKYDGDINFDTSEVEQVKFVSKSELDEILKIGKIHPQLAFLLNNFTFFE